MFLFRKVFKHFKIKTSDNNVDWRFDDAIVYRKPPLLDFNKVT